MSDDLPIVTVLMSTYNGEEFLIEQLESVLSQKGIDLRLVIRDDGSTDNTLDLLNYYKDQIDLLIKGENIGVSKSFFELMKLDLVSDYYAFADQDDIWDEDKLVTALTNLSKIDEHVPAMYHSNLRVVNREGSFIRLSHSKPRNLSPKFASLVENQATGCTIVYNSVVADITKLCQVDDFPMHDVWTYMLCRLLGIVVYDEMAHISYRQHSGNVVGTPANNLGIDRVKREYKRIFINNNGFRDRVSVFYDSVSEFLSDYEKKKIRKFLDYDKSILTRIQVLTDQEIWPDDKYRRIRFMLQTIFGKL